VESGDRRVAIKEGRVARAVRAIRGLRVLEAVRAVKGVRVAKGAKGAKRLSRTVITGNRGVSHGLSFTAEGVAAGSAAHPRPCAAGGCQAPAH